MTRTIHEPLHPSSEEISPLGGENVGNADKRGPLRDERGCSSKHAAFSWYADIGFSAYSTTTMPSSLTVTVIPSLT